MPENKLRSKAPNTKDTQDLLKDLEFFTPSDDDVILEEDYKNDSLAFISAYNLLPGNELVNKTVIQYLYSQWSKNKIAPARLVLELGKFFTTEYKKGKTFYHLNQDAMALTKAGYSIAKQKTQDVTKSKSRKKHFESFLDAHDITPGKYFIEGHILFYLYDKWTYENKNNNPLGDIRFYALLHLYFKCKAISVNETRYFGISEEGFFKHISNRKINKLRKAKDEKVKRQDKHGFYKEGKKRKKKHNPLARIKPWTKPSE